MGRPEPMDPASFVRLFIRKERRERLAFELTQPERLPAGLDRFCHRAEELLEAKRILMQGEDLERRGAFARFLAQRNERCRLLSRDLLPDAPLLPAEDAVRQALLCFDAVLILGSSFAIVFGEVMKGGRGKYLLAAPPREKPYP